MTDVVALAKKLYRSINQQTTRDPIGRDELIDFIKDAIEELYIISGREAQFSEDMFDQHEEGEGDEKELVCTFADDLHTDEKRWVVLDAEIKFYGWVQNSVDDMYGYQTDAMSVTHADKPYKNIGETIADRRARRNRIWYTMVRHNTVGVAE